MVPAFRNVYVVIAHYAPCPTLYLARRPVMVRSVGGHAKHVAWPWGQRLSAGNMIQSGPWERDFHCPSFILHVRTIDASVYEYCVLQSRKLIAQICMAPDFFALPCNIV